MTRTLILRTIRAALLASGIAAWVAMAALYALDASPFHSLELTVRWWRVGDAPAPSHQETGAVRVQP